VPRSPQSSKDVKSVSFKFPDPEVEAEIPTTSNGHQAFMQKQAEAITTNGFVDSPNQTPVPQGEIVGADGRPLPYRLKTPEHVQQVEKKDVDVDGSEKTAANGAPITSPVKSKSM